MAISPKIIGTSAQCYCPICNKKSYLTFANSPEKYKVHYCWDCEALSTAMYKSEWLEKTMVWNNDNHDAYIQFTRSSHSEDLPELPSTN